MVVGAVWTLSWIVLSVAQLTPGVASALFVTTFGIFAVGETMYAPVLKPADRQPRAARTRRNDARHLHRHQTTFSALGPLVAGALLGLGLANGFLGLHQLISLVAIYGAWRLRPPCAPVPPRSAGASSRCSRCSRSSSRRSSPHRLRPPRHSRRSQGSPGPTPLAPTGGSGEAGGVDERR